MIEEEKYFVEHDPNRYASAAQYKPLYKIMRNVNWAMIRSNISNNEYRIISTKYMNFDHLVENSPKMAQYVELCPNVKIRFRYKPLSTLVPNDNELIIAKIVF